MRKRVNEGGKGDQENESLFEGVEFLKKEEMQALEKLRSKWKNKKECDAIYALTHASLNTLP